MYPSAFLSARPYPPNPCSPLLFLSPMSIEVCFSYHSLTPQRYSVFHTSSSLLQNSSFSSDIQLVGNMHWQHSASVLNFQLQTYDPVCKHSYLHNTIYILFFQDYPYRFLFLSVPWQNRLTLPPMFPAMLAFHLVPCTHNIQYVPSLFHLYHQLPPFTFTPFI